MNRSVDSTAPYDLPNFSLRDMTDCGAILRKMGPPAVTMEAVANDIVRYLYDCLQDKTAGRRACALVRFFKTHPYDDLDESLRRFALRMLDGRQPPPGMKCLTLMATAGDRPEWNDRQMSNRHKAIPLPSADLVVQSPMISQLVKQFGLEPDCMVQPDPTLLVDLEQRTYNVFHVHEARTCYYVPAQEDFVIPCGIRSVLGFGGMLPSGNLFVVILFAKVRIGRDVAEMFRPLALSVKLAILPFEGKAVFG
jgi:hypothetical protein